MDTQNYLDRIGIKQVQKPDLAFLQKLMSQHLLTVPFENLHVRQGQEILLQPEHLYTKIVVQKRGGFCYELNGLFCWLLEHLGFSVSLISARVYSPDDNTFSPEYDHMALLVHLDKSYLVDVGFGDSVRQPIVLPNGNARDFSGNYQISQQQSDERIYLLQQQNGHDWNSLYRFSDTPGSLSDFTDRCRYNSTSSRSHFTQKTVCTIATKDGRVTLSNENLTIAKNGRKSKTGVSSEDHFNKLLAKHFLLTW